MDVFGAALGGGDLFHQRLAFTVEHVGDDDRCAMLREQPCLGGALPAAGAGDQRDFAVQRLFHQGPSGSFDGTLCSSGPMIAFHVWFLKSTSGGLSSSTAVCAVALQPATSREILISPSV